MGNEYNDIDKNLVKRGWASMKDHLDKEMPAETPQRKWVLWLVVGTLELTILGMGFMGWWLYFNKTMPASAPTSTAQQNSYGGSNHSFDLNGAATMPQPSGNTIGTGYTSARPFQPYPQPFFAQKQGWNYPAPTNVPLFGFGFHPSHTANLTPNDNGYNGFAYNWLQPTNRRTDSDLYILPTKPTVAIASMEQKEMPWLGLINVYEPISQHRQSKFRFGLTAGVQPSSPVNFNGYFGGILVDFAAFNNFGFQVGANYHVSKFNPSSTQTPVAEVDGRSYYSVTGDTSVLQSRPGGLGTGGNNTATFQPAVVFIPITQMQRIEFPILTYWQPVEQIRVYGGARIGRLVSAKSGTNTLAQFDNSTTESDALRTLSANKLVLRNFPKWDLQYQMGFGFRVNRHFEFNVMAKSAFKSRKGANFVQTMDETNTIESISTKRNMPVFQFSGTYVF